MSQLILHHYDLSPYSEAMRLLLGLKGLAWKSVDVPMIMPKPDLVALTGAYRRVPVLQIGADIYCDTKTVAPAIDALGDGPSIFPGGREAEIKALAAMGESMFMCGVVVFLAQGGIFPEDFIEDRKKMVPGGFEPAQARIAQASKLDQLRSYLEALDRQLQVGGPFLLGDAPTFADFAVYHPVWFFGASPLTQPLVDRLSAVCAWRDRIAAFGHGTREEISADEAIAVAKAAVSSTVDQLDEHDPSGRRPGVKVQVMPEDYAMDPVVGELVASNADEIAIRRVDERAGEVIVHFPRTAYLTLPA